MNDFPDTLFNDLPIEQLEIHPDEHVYNLTSLGLPNGELVLGEDVYIMTEDNYYPIRSERDLIKQPDGSHVLYSEEGGSCILSKVLSDELLPIIKKFLSFTNK